MSENYNEEVKLEEAKEDMETWEGFGYIENICDMIFEADLKKLNEVLKKEERRRLMFGPKVIEAEALVEVEKREILCRVKTKTQEAYVILTYERVWEYSPENFRIVFRTLLV